MIVCHVIGHMHRSFGSRAILPSDVKGTLYMYITQMYCNGVRYCMRVNFLSVIEAVML